MPRNPKKPAAGTSAGEVVQAIREEVRQCVEKTPDSFRQHFDFALQNRFRGSEAEVGGKLRPYLAEMQRLQPPDGPWIDLGCGRGEWVAMVREAGREAVGVDNNEFAVGRCRELDVPVEQKDVIEHLSSLPDASVAVVTAFHLFPRCQLDYLLALMREVARVLAPGGLIAMEAPQPSNPIVSSNNFWIDPGHIRLMPHQLMEFIFQYFGLRVIWHAHLNEHHAYGAQDYGFVAKRA